MFRLCIILLCERIEMFQLRKCFFKYDWLSCWLPAQWDWVFSGDHQQIAIISLNMYVMLIIEM